MLRQSRGKSGGVVQSGSWPVTHVWVHGPGTVLLLVEGYRPRAWNLCMTDDIGRRSRLGFHEDWFHVLEVADTCRVFYFMLARPTCEMVGARVYRAFRSCKCVCVRMAAFCLAQQRVYGLGFRKPPDLALQTFNPNTSTGNPKSLNRSILSLLTFIHK